MIARIDLVVSAFDSTVGVDKEADAFGISCLEARAGAVCQCHLVRSIAEQPEAEGAFASEGGVVGDAVEAEADYLDSALVEKLPMIAQSAPFQTPTRRVRSGDEP